MGLLLLTASVPARAHDLQHQVETGPPMTLHFFFPDESKFSFENFEIMAPGDSMVFQKGRTDALGRVLLAPDRPGAWRVRVFSDDGHGADVTVDVDAARTLKTYSRSLFDRYSRAFAGAGFILGAFGFINLFNSLLKRRKNRT
jgi:nickel transport protein